VSLVRPQGQGQERRCSKLSFQATGVLTPCKPIRTSTARLETDPVQAPSARKTRQKVNSAVHTSPDRRTRLSKTVGRKNYLTARRLKGQVGFSRNLVTIRFKVTSKLNRKTRTQAQILDRPRLPVSIIEREYRGIAQTR
jgi:hypothetical protein